MACLPIFKTLILASFLLLPQFLGAANNDHRPFSVRNYNPFTRVFGLPMYPDFNQVNPGQLSFELVSDIANHADASTNHNEAVVLDGESYLTNLLFRYGASQQLVVGVDIPHIADHTGFLDGVIEDWHDVMDLSNGNRQGSNNRLRFIYTRDQIDLYEIDENSQGIGDIRLSAAYQLRSSVQSGLVLRTNLKLPTGNSDRLRGSDATDVSLDLSLYQELLLWGESVAVSSHGGVLILGDGDVLPDLQEELVLYGGAGLSWKTSGNLYLVTQVNGHSRYFDSELDELGTPSLQWVIGGRYHWPNKNLDLGMALVQDVFSDTTPDVTFHFNLRVVYP